MSRGRPSKKQLILDTARNVFAESGYQGTSIDIVVQQAGVSKPTVYNNFPSKQVLWLQLMEQMIEEINSARTAINNEDIAEALYESFEMLTKRSDWISIYRICIGERYKLEGLVNEPFEQLLNSHKQWIVNYLAKFDLNIDNNQLWMINAIGSELLITPTLLDKPVQSIEMLRQALKQIL